MNIFLLIFILHSAILCDLVSTTEETNYNSELSSKYFSFFSSCRNYNHVFSSLGQSVSFSSLNYPYNYPINQDCSYFFKSPVGTIMTVSCNPFNVDCSANDYLSISLSGRKDFSDASNYCGLEPLLARTTSGNSLSIGFHSSGWRWTWTFPFFGLFRPSQNHRRFHCTISVNRMPTPKPTTTTKPKCSCGVRNVNGANRIIGGVATKTGEIPWRVAVSYVDSDGIASICGGTIISPSWIMTASHCTMNKDDTDILSVYTGAQANPITIVGGVTRHIVDNYTQHPDFDRDTLNNDICLLHLAKPLDFTKNVSPACLPWNYVNKDFNGSPVLASGWGLTDPVPVTGPYPDTFSATLREVTLTVLNTQECKKTVKDVTDNMICTYKKGADTCKGDSGGSIDYFENSIYYAIGIVSYGSGCAQENEPGVYTKVTKYLKWIEDVTRKKSLENFE